MMLKDIFRNWGVSCSAGPVRKPRTGSRTGAGGTRVQRSAGIFPLDHRTLLRAVQLGARAARLLSDDGQVDSPCRLEVRSHLEGPQLDPLFLTRVSMDGGPSPRQTLLCRTPSLRQAPLQTTMRMRRSPAGPDWSNDMESSRRCGQEGSQVSGLSKAQPLF